MQNSARNGKRSQFKPQLHCSASHHHALSHIETALGSSKKDASTVKQVANVVLEA